MKQKYLAIFEKSEDGHCVSLPDFPGCVSAGKSVEDAIVSTEEALAFHIKGMIEDKDDIPTPCLYEDAASEIDFEFDFVTWIEATIPSKKGRYTITMDKDLADEIERIAGNRSGFLEDAARAKLAIIMAE